MIIFDLGSNATKASLVIDQHIVKDWRISTKLGKDVANDGSLSDEAIQRQSQAIEQVLHEAEKYCGDISQIRSIHALGTQAIRKAPNAQKLVQILKMQFNLPLEIISGDEEAELEKEAVWNCKARLAHPNMRILTMDSGGSSTEINLLETDGTTITRHSYPFGQHDILRAIEQNLDMPFEEMMHELVELCDTYEPKLIIAAGSSITTYAGYTLKIIPFSADRVESQKVCAGAAIPEEDRAAQVGKCLIEALDEQLKLPIFVTTRGIRHGWLQLSRGSAPGTQFASCNHGWIE